LSHCLGIFTSAEILEPENLSIPDLKMQEERVDKEKVINGNENKGGYLISYQKCLFKCVCI
jgi:hypothetical protein